MMIDDVVTVGKVLRPNVRNETLNAANSLL